MIMKYTSEIKKSTSEHLITINNCGETRAASECHVFRASGRSDYQVIYVAGGHCVVTIDGGIHIAASGDCILYRPGEVQDYFLSRKAGTHTYWVHFNGEICRGLFETLSLQKVHIVKAEQNRVIEHLAAEICRNYNLNVPHRELICSGLLQSVLALISNEAHKTRTSGAATGADKISELITHIKMVPDMNITVAEAAAFCHMSKPHFARVFRQTTGVSTMKFLQQIRIERAKELLDFTDSSVAEIAQSCGFQDQNYFARVFKQVTGGSPVRYRSRSAKSSD